MLISLRSLVEDFPVTSSYPNSLFVAAPFGNAVSAGGFVTVVPWAGHDSVTGTATGTSSAHGLVYSSGIQAPAAGASQNGRASAFFVSTAVESTDPTTLVVSGLWRGSFSAAPWNGTASLGTSGAHALAHIGTDPTSGTAVNGYTPASYASASSQQLADTTDLMSDLFRVSAYTIVVLFNATTAFTATGTITDSPCFLADGSGIVGLCYDSNGVTLFHDDATYKTVTTAAAIGLWVVVMAYFDGSNLYLRINNGAWSSPVAAGNLTTLAASIVNGRNWSAANFFNGSILEMITATTAISTANLDGIGRYLQARYAISLGF